MLNYYINLLGDVPEFLNKYLNVPSLLRLKNIGYFCGMDYASKDIYQFSELISRYDHSLSVALMTWKFTKDKKATIASLFHDVATPCFAHVIDYMNKDYDKQESTEEYTFDIMSNDKELLRCLKEDNLSLDDIDFKKYSIVDNERPKLCADRLDGLILTGIGWTKRVNEDIINLLVSNITVYKNDDGEEELGFKSYEAGQMALKISEEIDLYCHSIEDNYMMELLAKITKRAIELVFISYDDLYRMNEKDLIARLKESSLDIKVMMNIFENVKREDIKEFELPNVKVRDLNPLVMNLRLKR